MKLIVFDLDGTLVHRTANGVSMMVRFPGIRFGVWTAANRSNAKMMVDVLQEHWNKMVPGILFDFVLTRDDCIVFDQDPNRSKDDENNGIGYKHLNIIWKRYQQWNKHNTVIIDDRPERCMPSENVWVIKEFVGDPDDLELMRLHALKNL